MSAKVEDFDIHLMGQIVFLDIDFGNDAAGTVHLSLMASGCPIPIG